MTVQKTIVFKDRDLAQWAKKCWYLVISGVAVGRGFKPQSDLALFFAKIINIYSSA
jgi:hypothetical protein